MGAPSDLHETRVAYIRDLGILASHTVDFTLARWERPDVCLRDPNRLRLFVGDAKASETSTNAETRRRLRSYASAAVPWRRAGFSVCIAVCVTGHPADGWEELLTDLAPGVSSAMSATVGPGERLVWVDLPPVVDEVGGRRYRSGYGQFPHRRRHVLRGGRAL